jgi:recombination protein RecR
MDRDVNKSYSLPPLILLSGIEMSFSPLIRQLIDSLRILPGVGQKSAQRMALQMLERDRSGGQRLAAALQQAMERVGHCSRCRTLSEDALCPQCADPRRDDSVLCVVQSPVDVFAVDQTGFRGRYFVLKGHLSPLDGLGPEAIGIPELMARVEDAAELSEVILATNPTVEGEATAHYIAQLLAQRALVVSRLAHGIPLGGELDLVDGGTLAHAFAGRKPMSS